MGETTQWRKLFAEIRLLDQSQIWYMKYMTYYINRDFRLLSNVVCTVFLSKGVGLLRPILLFLLNEGISGMESDASQNKTEHLFMFMHNGLKHVIL